MRRRSLTELRAGAQPVRAEDARELQRRLGPDAVADRDCTGDVQAARDALEDRRPLVGLVHDDHLALGLLVQVQDGEHARQQEDGIRARPEERARDPAVRVRQLAEARDLPLEPRQVFEIGRRPEKERADAFGLEVLVESTSALCVVEHAADPTQLRAADDLVRVA